MAEKKTAKKENSEVEVVISPDSERLQALTPFDSFDASNYIDMTVIMKAVGKCTTDHISPAGSIKEDSPAGLYLNERQISSVNFNS